MFPSKYGVSDVLSGSLIVEIIPKADLGKKYIAFISYEMVHIGKINKIKRRCVLVIALNKSNYAGGYYFMNIFTGERMHSYNWKELPIKEELIKN